MVTGFLSAPTAMGISGHRSRTSNTMRARLRRAAQMAGNAIDRGVLVANMTLPPSEAALRAASHEKRAKAIIRARKPMWFE